MFLGGSPRKFHGSQRNKRRKRRLNNLFPESFERDWEFYLKNKDKFVFCGRYVLFPEYDPTGLSAKECFYVFDTQGKSVSCSEPTLFHDVLVCKKSIGFHIKLWSEGYHDICIPMEEYVQEFIYPPEWVITSLYNQIQKNHLL